jgi:hypothetical protein
MTRLPAVFAVISRPSRMLTPDEISVPNVRVKRETADFRQHVAQHRHLEQQLVDVQLPLGDA